MFSYLLIKLILIFGTLSAYAFLLNKIRQLWISLNEPTLNNSYPSDCIYFTIIIPARNEENNIKKCLTAIQNQRYPQQLFEIIVIDDFSTDKTVEIVKNFNCPNLHAIELSKIDGFSENLANKKAATNYAIKLAQGEYIINTDADCHMPNLWLASFANCIKTTKAQFIAAPVVLESNSTLIQDFQTLDFVGLMMTTAAGINWQSFYLSNGANMCYSKASFIQASTILSHTHLASGDDVFLIQAIAKNNPNDIVFLKSKQAIVYTQAQASWKNFFHQRIRWASKTRHYPNKQLSLLSLFIGFVNLIPLLLLITSTINAFYLYLFLSYIIIKTITEYRYLNTASSFFNTKHLMKFPRFTISAILQIAYISILGGLALFTTKYSWKGRKVQ